MSVIRLVTLSIKIVSGREGLREERHGRDGMQRKSSSQEWKSSGKKVAKKFKKKAER